MNNFTKFASAFLLLSLISLSAFAQSDRLHCGSAAANNKALAEDPNAMLQWEQLNQLSILNEKNHTSNKSGVISYTIPVVYHVIHNNGPENVSKADIEASVQNLNEDFQKLNADISQVVPAFQGIAADCEIQFRLAHLDPNGNCTEGITRTVSTLTYAADENVKSLVKWNVNNYLNVWVVQTLSSGAGGYSYYPGVNHNNSGIVIRSAQLGNSMTHEVGHYLNLPHVWGSSNTPGQSTNCSLDDGVNDTPNSIGQTTCNTAAQSCGSLDNVQNYMEYSFCERMFTEGQKSRMHTALNSSVGNRNNLHSASNLAATGTADPYNPVICTPIAEFTHNRDYICEGSTITFTDQSYNATPTTWNWTFTGGTPSSSNQQNPTITYNTAGTYSVSHQPGTTAGTDTKTKNNIIVVSSLTADYSGSVVDGFESTTQFNNDWRIENEGGGQTWQNTNGAAATGSRSVRIRNYFTSTDGLVDELISPSYDISSLTNKVMTFKHAFAKTTTGNTDKLLVYWSTNCGESWTLKLPLTAASTLTTAPDHGSIFVPTSTEWEEKTIDLTGVASATNVRFKFAFTSGGGNDLYLDDINIGGPNSVDEFSNIASFNVYPNPTNSSAKVSFNLTKNVNNLSIKLKNTLGQNVANVINSQSFNAGNYTLNIDENRKLAPGIYLVEFNADNNIKIQKLIVQ